MLHTKIGLFSDFCNILNRTALDRAILCAVAVIAFGAPARALIRR
jgi:hypothetical protein